MGIMETSQNRYSFEGSSGVREFEDFCRKIGYHKGEFFGDHPIHNFLADNPGVFEAISEWIDQHISEEQLESIGYSKCRECDEFFEMTEGMEDSNMCPNCHESLNEENEP